MLTVETVVLLVGQFSVEDLQLVWGDSSWVFHHYLASSDASSDQDIRQSEPSLSARRYQSPRHQICAESETIMSRVVVRKFIQGVYLA